MNTRIPDGMPQLTPMLICADAAAAMEFCKTVFDAEELNRRHKEDGTVGHGLLRIGRAMVMIEGEFSMLASRAPSRDGRSPAVMYLYLEDVDAAAARAVAAGGTLLVAPADQFWGDRTARVLDPAGHVWLIASRMEETSEAQRQERWSELRKQVT